MTARPLPYIKRVRQTRYQATDGTFFASHVEAFRHETFIRLVEEIYGATSMDRLECEGLAKLLLKSKDFRIVLLGPKVQEEDAK